MNKVQSVIPGTSEYNGKSTPIWDIACQMTDGTMRGARSYRELKAGDIVEDDDFKRNKKGDGWVIWSEKKGGGKPYQRNDELTISQVAFKGMVDLVVGNKLSPQELNSDTCIRFATVIKRTAAAITAPANPGSQTSSLPPAAGALAGQPPSAHGANPDKVPPPPEGGTVPQIKSMGELRTKIHKEYPALKTVAAQDAIIGKDIKDFDAAFQKVVDSQEGDIKW